tara:strand:- start:369 stop:572 length:204 start_codon:yes stop_codon:yes gene_type:complete
MERLAYPKTGEGKINYDIVLTGDDLLEFVNKELFPHLAGFKQIKEIQEVSITKLVRYFLNIKKWPNL